MNGEARLLRMGEFLIGCACRRLPAGARDERYREWTSELPWILNDQKTRFAAVRVLRMLACAADHNRTAARFRPKQQPVRKRSTTALILEVISVLLGVDLKYAYALMVTAVGGSLIAFGGLIAFAIGLIAFAIEHGMGWMLLLQAVSSLAVVPPLVFRQRVRARSRKARPEGHP